MSNIQKTLDSLQPYVIGIRYLEGTVLVDVVFKDGWTVPEDAKIKKAKSEENVNYYMIFSEVKGIGLDELLDYVDKTIKINLEREKKHELLKEKVNEMKEIFKKHPLTKLVRMRFTFDDEQLVPSLNDFDIDIDDELEPLITPSEHDSQPTFNEEERYEEPTEIREYLDENGNAIELSEEDLELLEEEARAERNRRITESKKQKNGTTPLSKKVELPPRRKPELVTNEYYADCDCGPDGACEKCIDSK